MANTDAQALQQSRAGNKLQLGARVTEGLGAGARPEVGAAAAEELIEEIVERLSGCHMCFITAGMGGGTGTGAAPIIAKAAREMGILTVGVVTKPFQFEGSRRMKQAERGVEELQGHVDTLIIIPNQNLFRLANEKTTFTEAFALADDVLYQGVKGVTDLMVRPGIINLDFADVRSVMNEMGKAMMGTGEAAGEDRAVQAAEKAIANPLLDEISLKGAKGVLINITAGPDLTLFELDEAANRIRAEVDPEANIMVGSTLDPEMAGQMRVSVVATGIDAVAKSDAMPMPRRASRAGRRRGPGRRRASRSSPQPAARAGARRRASPTTTVAEVEREVALRRARGRRGRAAAGLAAPDRALRPAEVRGGPMPSRAGRASPRPTRSAGCSRRCRTCRRRSRWSAPWRRRPASRSASRLTINSLIHKMTGQVGREQAPGRPRPAEFEPRAPSRPSPTTKKPSANASTFPPSFVGRPTDGGSPPPPLNAPAEAPGYPPTGCLFHLPRGPLPCSRADAGCGTGAEAHCRHFRGTRPTVAIGHKA